MKNINNLLNKKAISCLNCMNCKSNTNINTTKIQA